MEERATKLGDSLASPKELGKLKNPSLPADEKLRLETMKADRDAQLAEWERSNPRPDRAGKKPKPEDFGVDPAKLLSKRKFYYRQPLGTTGAQIGGVSARNPIHADGHTWFPPGWDAEPIMRLLETNAAGISETPMSQDGVVSATKRTAWIKRNSDGAFEVAPAGTGDPAAAGYLKSSMIIPADGAKRTVFPEMNQ